MGRWGKDQMALELLGVLKDWEIAKHLGYIESNMKRGGL